jgi:2-polyprenyl-3-methyl-5-hydroxy-6-metoxy-1,4-benzoquinol methylase
MKLAVLGLLLTAPAFPQADEYNPIYRGDAGEVFSRKPNAFLVEMLRHRRPGTALDVGMGQGRNSIFLAQQGWEVTGFDPSDEGVRQAPEPRPLVSVCAFELKSIHSGISISARINGTSLY